MKLNKIVSTMCRCEGDVCYDCMLQPPLEIGGATEAYTPRQVALDYLLRETRTTQRETSFTPEFYRREIARLDGAVDVLGILDILTLTEVEKLDEILTNLEESTRQTRDPERTLAIFETFALWLREMGAREE